MFSSCPLEFKKKLSVNLSILYYATKFISHAKISIAKWSWHLAVAGVCGLWLHKCLKTEAMTNLAQEVDRPSGVAPAKPDTPSFAMNRYTHEVRASAGPYVGHFHYSLQNQPGSCAITVSASDRSLQKT